jgi:hypothetical protein
MVDLPARSAQETEDLAGRDSEAEAVERDHRSVTTAPSRQLKRRPGVKLAPGDMKARTDEYFRGATFYIRWCQWVVLA